MTPTFRSSARPWLVLALALAVLGLALGLPLAAERADIQHQEHQRLLVQARVVAINLGRQIEAVNGALQGLSSSCAPGGQANVLQAVLRNPLPGVQMLACVGADGLVQASSRLDQVGRSLSKRLYFQQGRAQSDPAVLYVAEPYLNDNAVWSIALFRVQHDTQGRFEGLVLATLDPAYFMVMMDSVLYAADMRAVLIHGKGAVFLNTPSNDPVLGVNADRPGSMFRQHRAAGSVPSVHEGETSAGQYRMAALHTLLRADLNMDSALVVAIGREPQAVFAAWQRSVWVMSVAYLLVVLASSAALMWALRRHRLHGLQRAEHQAELQHSEARFRGLTRLSSDWYWEQDEQLRFVQVAMGSEYRFQGRPETYLGKLRWDVPALNLTPQDWVQHRAGLDARLPFHDFQVLRDVPGSGLVWVTISGEPIFETDGRFTGYRGVGRDITAQVQASDALRRSEQRMQLVLRGSDDGPWDVDLQSGQSYVSERCSAMLGLPVDDPQLQAQAWMSLCHPDDSAEVTRLFRQALKSRSETFALQLRVRHQLGHFVPIEIRAFILRNGDGRALRIAGVTSDLSERQRVLADREKLILSQAEQLRRGALLASAEQAQQQAQAHAQGLAALLAERDRSLHERDELLSLLAHEVRQPLNNASAALQGVAMAVSDPHISAADSLGRLTRAQGVLDRVANTIHNALVASVSLSSTERFGTHETDITAVIKLALVDLDPEQQARVQLQPISGVQTVEINSALVRLALRNLLVNALNYSAPDSVVTVAVHFRDEPLAVVIEVTDQGDGIPAELLPRLFERGSRGPQAARVVGAGLGLYAVARVAALHGGQIQVRPVLPRGSCFVLVLPQGQLAEDFFTPGDTTVAANKFPHNS